jgi:hypothetical protein
VSITEHIAARRLWWEMASALAEVGQDWPQAERRALWHPSWSAGGDGPRWLQGLEQRWGLDRAEIEGLYLASMGRLPEWDSTWTRGQWSLEVLPGLVSRYRGEEAA